MNREQLDKIANELRQNNVPNPTTVELGLQKCDRTVKEVCDEIDNVVCNVLTEFIERIAEE